MFCSQSWLLLLPPFPKLRLIPIGFVLTRAGQLKQTGAGGGGGNVTSECSRELPGSLPGFRVDDGIQRNSLHLFLGGFRKSSFPFPPTLFPPPKRKGMPLKIKATLCLKNTEGSASLKLLYSAKKKKHLASGALLVLRANSEIDFPSSAVKTK